MSNGISELQCNAESRVYSIVQTPDTGYSGVNKLVWRSKEHWKFAAITVEVDELNT